MDMSLPVICMRLKVPFECGFRRETGINTHRTYPVPPFTAVLGLLGNAMGLPQDFDLPFRVDVGIGMIDALSVHQTLTKILKRSHPSEKRYLYTSTLVTKERLYKPAYKVWLEVSPEFVQTVYGALRDPERLLYLGGSDDVVEIEELKLVDGMPVQSGQFASLVPFDQGTLEGEADVVQLPVRFSRRPEAVHKRLFYVSPLVRLTRPIDARRVEGEDVFFVAGETAADL